MKRPWDEIEAVFIVGNDTLADIGTRFDIPPGTVRTRASRNNWKLKRDTFRASVTAQYLDEARNDQALDRSAHDTLSHIVADISAARSARSIIDAEGESITAILDQARKSTDLKYKILGIAPPKISVEHSDAVDAFALYQERLAFHRADIDARVGEDGLIEVRLEKPTEEEVWRTRTPN